MAKKDINENAQETLLELEKKYNALQADEFIKTDILSLDIVFGGQGIPRGKYIELCSPSGLGKSTLLLHASKNLCDAGYKVMWIDTEGASSEVLLNCFDLTNHLMSKENSTGNFILYKACLYSQVDEIMDKVISTCNIDFVIIDSLTAIVPDLLGETLDNNLITIMQQRPGYSAQVQTRFIQKYMAFKIKYNTTFIFVNQQRTKINISGYGAPTTISAAGATAIGYSMDCRLELSNAGKITEKHETVNGIESVVVGANIWIQSIKSRFSQPFIKVPGVIYFGKGYSNIMTLVGFMKMKQIEYNGEMYPMISQSGSFFKITTPHEQKQVQGNTELKEYISEKYDELISCFNISDFSLIKQ